jgi:hypothetical protein
MEIHGGKYFLAVVVMGYPSILTWILVTVTVV